MSINTKIVKPLESGYVQVDTVNKTGYIRHYKVPKVCARTFSNEIKQQSKNMDLYSNLTMFSSIFLGVIGASFFIKKIESKMMQYLIQMIAAFGLMTLSSFGFEKYANIEQEKLAKKFKAKEIFYRA